MLQLTPNRPLSKHDENRLLSAARRVLLTGGFPNPERTGCPGADTLRDIASRRIGLAQSEDWIDHIGSCSPCFTEYDAFRKSRIKQRRIRLSAIAAGIALVITIGAWAWLGNWRILRSKQHNITETREAEVFQPYVLDLRDWLVLRGVEEPPKRPLLKLPRARLSLAIYLPVGSEPDNYEMAISDPTGKQLVAGTGSAQLENHITVLRVRTDLRKLKAGDYVMGIRERNNSWYHYPIVLP